MGTAWNNYIGKLPAYRASHDHLVDRVICSSFPSSPDNLLRRILSNTVAPLDTKGSEVSPDRYKNLRGTRRRKERPAGHPGIRNSGRNGTLAYKIRPPGLLNFEHRPVGLEVNSGCLGSGF